MATSASALLLKTAVQSFWNSYYSIPDPFDGLVYTRSSDQKTDTYTRLGAAPMPVEFSGNRQAKMSNEYTFTATNVPYDSTVSIDKELVKYQQWDEVASLTANQGLKAMAHKTSLLTTALVAGVSTVGDDGQFFFDTDHADPGSVYTAGQDNDLTAAAGAGTVPTDLEGRVAIRAMFDAFFTFKDDRGDPQVPATDNLSASDFVLMIPPEFLTIIRQLQLSTTVTGPLANDIQGTFNYRVNPFLTGGNQMFMFYAGSNHKPMIVQQTGSLENRVYEDPHSGNFNHSATWWGVVTYGQWRTAVSYVFT